MSIFISECLPFGAVSVVGFSMLISINSIKFDMEKGANSSVNVRSHFIRRSVKSARIAWSQI